MRYFLISPFPLHPVLTGAARRSMAMVDYLSGQGHTVHVFCPVSNLPSPKLGGENPASFIPSPPLGEEGSDRIRVPAARRVDEEVVEAERRKPVEGVRVREGVRWFLMKRRPTTVHLFQPSLLRALWNEASRGADGIILSFPFQIIPVWLVSRRWGIPLYLDEHNVEHVRLHSMGRKWAALAVFFLEWFAVRSAKEVIAVSTKDQFLLQRRFGRRIRCIPNGVDTKVFAPVHISSVLPAKAGIQRLGVWSTTTPIRHRLLFFGNFAYRPNRDALDFVRNTLAPFLSGTMPQALIQIAGPFVPDISWPANVQVLGAVPRIQDTIAQADLVIAPLAESSGGGGSRLKIVEAMACGKNVLSSPAAAEGLSADTRAAIRIVPLKNFAKEIVDYFAGRWPQDLGPLARQAAESLDWNICFRNLDCLGSPTKEVLA